MPTLAGRLAKILNIDEAEATLVLYKWGQEKTEQFRKERHLSLPGVGKIYWQDGEPTLFSEI